MMSKALRVLGYLLAGLFLILIVAALYLKFALPNIPLKEVKVEATPERIAKGKYLANHVLVCIDCHSTRDWSTFSGPPMIGTEGKGGDVFDETMGFPGTYYSANITPFHLSDWTDGEIYRAITSGVGKNNNALFPVMPYLHYGQLADEDIFNVIAYIRSLPSINFTPPKSTSNFPVNFIINTMPQSGSPVKKPEKSNQLAYGKYMTTASGCVECHTPFEQGALIMEKAFGGGRVFEMPSGVLTASNITPHNTGIGTWTKEQFVNRFKSYDPKTNTLPKVKEGEFNTIMPWAMYAGMDTFDLEAIYVYLQSLDPIENTVVPFAAK